MAKFRKLPIVVEAVQFDPADLATQEHVCFSVPQAPGCASSLDGKYWIQTREGPLIVSPGDWIITGVKGERYPCKPDVFAATYEPAGR